MRMCISDFSFIKGPKWNCAQFEDLKKSHHVYIVNYTSLSATSRPCGRQRRKEDAEQSLPGLVRENLRLSELFYCVGIKQQNMTLFSRGNLDARPGYQ